MRLSDSSLLENRTFPIQEAYSLIPFGLSKIDSVSGMQLYSSDKLKDKFATDMGKQSEFSHVASSIEKLVKQGKILPSYLSKNAIRFLVHKLFGSPDMRNMLAFFSPAKNKVYVLMDNAGTFSAHIKFLTSIVMHEMQHYCAWNMKISFLKMHQNTFITFYTKFYKFLFDIQLTSADAAKIIKYAYVNFESNVEFPSNFLVEYAKFHMDILTPYIKSEDERYKLISKYMAVIQIYFKDPNIYRNMIRNDPATKAVFFSLLDSYEELGIRNPNTLCIQETIYPSEVIAIQSQYRLNSNHLKGIQTVA